MTRFSIPGWLALALVASGCTNYTDQLQRAEQHYGNARYEASLANLEDLEPSIGTLSQSERVRYDLVRGMTHLRLEQRLHARHWLAMAREDARAAPAALTDQQRITIERTLNELDPLGPRPASELSSGGSGNGGGESAGGTNDAQRATGGEGTTR